MLIFSKYFISLRYKVCFIIFTLLCYCFIFSVFGRLRVRTQALLRKSCFVTVRGQNLEALQAISFVSLRHSWVQTRKRPKTKKIKQQHSNVRIMKQTLYRNELI